MNRLEFKAAISVSDAGEITGIAWPFGSPDRVGDLIHKGAFQHGDTLPMLFGHDPDDVIGVWEIIRETAEGLTIKGRLLLDQLPRAREVYAMLKAKAVKGLSIGFQTLAATPRRGGGRDITKLDLVEVSIVSIPAHPGAQIQSIKELKLDTEDDVIDSPVEGRVATLETDVATIKAGLASVEKAATRIETKLARPGAAVEQKTDDGEIEHKAFGTYLRLGNNAPADELKSLTVSNDPQGGYLAPNEISAEFIRDLAEFSPIRSIASVRTTSAPAVSYPKRTGITNGKWKGETQTSEASNVTLGNTDVPIREINTYVDVSNQLLADSGGAAEAEVRLALAEDFGQKEGTAFVEGDGVLAPEGFLTNASILHTLNGHATTLSADALISLLYAMPAAYRNRGSWVLNGSTLAIIRKLKDGTTGTYLWQPSYAAGQPETILGRPVVEAIDMPDVEADAFPIAFGDFNTGYRIVDRLDLSILVNPYLLATQGMTRVHATRRTGAGVIQPNAIRKLKMAVA
jgi:HK97 family phage major capsid protein/HK97 family phage prohead protease